MQEIYTQSNREKVKRTGGGGILQNDSGTR